MFVVAYIRFIRLFIPHRGFLSLLFFLIPGDNGRIEYTITSGDDNNDFEIFSNGTIRTKRMLDRETKSSYNLIVTARDCAKEFPMMYDDDGGGGADDDHYENGNGDDHIAADADYDGAPAHYGAKRRLPHQQQHPSMPYNLPRQRRQYLLYQQQQQQQQQLLQHQQQIAGLGSEPLQRLSSTVQVSDLVSLDKLNFVVLVLIFMVELRFPNDLRFQWGEKAVTTYRYIFMCQM